MVKANRDFEKRLADNTKTDPKSLFAYTRSKTRTKDSVGPLVDNKGNVTTYSVETANVLNDYFVSSYLIKTTEESLRNVEFTTGVVLTKLLQLKPYKAPGVGNLSSTMLRAVAPAIASPLSEIFVESMTKEKF